MRTRLPIYAALASLLQLANPAAAADAQWPPSFELHDSLRGPGEDALRACLGKQPEVATIERLQRLLNTTINTFTQSEWRETSVAAAIIMSRGQWACVKLSEQGHPVWPAESLQDLIVPMGVAADAKLGWRTSMLRELAQSGSAKGLLLYPGIGNAQEIRIWAKPQDAGRINFSSKWLKAGSFDEQAYASVLRDPGLSGVSTKSEGGGGGDSLSRFAVPPRRLLRPTNGEFIVIAGNEATRRHAFEGTEWKDPKGPTRLWLQPGGLAIYSTARSSDNGTWARDDGVLHLSLHGGGRFSIALSDDGEWLHLHGRRPEASPPEEGPSEWQWAVQLQAAKR